MIHSRSTVPTTQGVETTPKLSMPAAPALSFQSLSSVMKAIQGFPDEAQKPLAPHNGSLKEIQFEQSPFTEQQLQIHIGKANIGEVGDLFNQATIFYHGTSSLFLDSIAEHGLNPKHRQFSQELVTGFLEIHKKYNRGEEYPLAYDVGDKEARVCISYNRFRAQEHASHKPEMLHRILRDAKDFLGKELDSADREFLEKKLIPQFEKHEKDCDEVRPVVLAISGAALNQIPEEESIASQLIVKEYRGVLHTILGCGADMKEDKFFYDDKPLTIGLMMELIKKNYQEKLPEVPKECIKGYTPLK